MKQPTVTVAVVGAVVALWFVGLMLFPALPTGFTYRHRIDARQALRVEAASFAPSQDGGRIDGDVVNDSDRTFRVVGVIFSLFDADGNPCYPMSTTNDQTMNVEPHSRWRFHCPLYWAKARSFRLGQILGN